MTVEDAPGHVTICSRRNSSMSASDAGVTVHSANGRRRFFPWAEVSCFADGIQATQDGPAGWVLDIVLRTGKTYSVKCTRGRSARPEMLAAVRQAAERYGIPADLTGVMITKDGLPHGPGLYEDPAGEDGLRYWEGTRWSPLLSSAGWRVRARKSTARWADLPVAPQPWTYPVARAARARAWLLVLALLTAAVIAAAIVTGRRSGHWDPDSNPLFDLAVAALCFLGWWCVEWLKWSRLEKRAKTALGRPN